MSWILPQNFAHCLKYLFFMFFSIITNSKTSLSVLSLFSSNYHHLSWTLLESLSWSLPLFQSAPKTCWSFKWTSDRGLQPLPSLFITIPFFQVAPRALNVFAVQSPWGIPTSSCLHNVFHFHGIDSISLFSLPQISLPSFLSPANSNSSINDWSTPKSLF